MSKVNLGRTVNQGVSRLGFDAYSITRSRYLELRNGCAEGKYSPETLSKACAGFEFIKPWILLSVTKGVSFDRLEFDLKLGRIPASRTGFYRYRRAFYNSLDKALAERGVKSEEV